MKLDLCHLSKSKMAWFFLQCQWNSSQGKKIAFLVSARQEVSRRCLFSKLRAWKSRVKKGQTDLLHLPVVKVGKQYKKIQLTLWGDVCILIMPTGQQCYDWAPDILEL